MKNKTKRILCKKGWIEKYYYVMKVLLSWNEKDTTLPGIFHPIYTTYEWGRDTLDRYLNQICEHIKDDDLKEKIQDEADYYLGILYDIFDNLTYGDIKK